MSTAKDLDLLLQKYIDRGLPGAALSVMQGDKLLYENYVGHRDIARTKPLTPDTLFRIHSITKAEYDYLWAAAALVNTYEAGVLLSNPPIVPSNVKGGTGIFGVSSEAVLRHEDVEKILRDDIIQIWPEE